MARLFWAGQTDSPERGHGASERTGGDTVPVMLKHGAQEGSLEQKPAKATARLLPEQGGRQSCVRLSGRGDSATEFPPRRTKQRFAQVTDEGLRWKGPSGGTGGHGDGAQSLVPWVTEPPPPPSFLPLAPTFCPHPLTCLLPLGCSEANPRYRFIFQFVLLRDYFPENDYNALSMLVPSLVPVSWTVSLIRACTWPTCCSSFMCLLDLSILRSSLGVV